MRIFRGNPRKRAIALSYVIFTFTFISPSLPQSFIAYTIAERKKNYQDEEKNKKNPIPQVCGFFTLFQLTETTIEPAAPKIF